MKLIGTVFLLLPALFSCKKDCKNENVDQQAYDIIIVAGQSNTCYGYGYDSLNYPKSKVLELGRGKYDLQIIPASPSLYNWNRDPLKSSFGYDFARYYSTYKSTRPVLVIACGEIGSSFLENRWNKGDILYEDLKSRVEYVVQKFPGSKVVTLLWQQGESDITNTNYQSDLDSMFLNIRSDLKQGNFPILLGGMVPYWVNMQPDRIAQQNIIKNTEQRLTNCFYVDPNGINKPNDDFDIIHYSDANHKKLAIKYWSTYRKHVFSISCSEFTYLK